MIKSIFTGFLALLGLVGGCPFSNKGCTECKEFHYRIEKLGRLPKSVSESSGLAKIENIVYTHGDSGNDPALYQFQLPITDTLSIKIRKIPHTINTDWEDLADNGSDKIYIGDFGNNGNNRKNLKVIEYDLKGKSVRTLPFSYELQKAFPPVKIRNQDFDCEAMFWSDGTLYLFSKNKSNKYVKVYSMSDDRYRQSLAPIDSINLKKSRITSADISPDHTEVVLLAYGRILFFNVEQQAGSGRFRFHPKSCRKFRRSGQAEAVLYLDNETLLITNEKGKVYRVSRKYKTLND